MLDVVIFTHGELSEGIKSAVKVLTGDSDKIKTLCLKAEDNIDEKEEEFVNIVSNISEYGIVFVDMVGGSPFNLSLKHSRDYPYTTVTGVNLPMIIECVMSLESTSKDNIDEFIDSLMQTGSEGISKFKM